MIGALAAGSTTTMRRVMRRTITRCRGTQRSPDGCACSTWADDVELTYDVPG